MALTNNDIKFIFLTSLSVAIIGCSQAQLGQWWYMAKTIGDHDSRYAISNAYMAKDGTILTNMDDAFYSGYMNIYGGISCVDVKKIRSDKCGVISGQWSGSERKYQYIDGGIWYMMGEWAISVSHDDKSFPSWDGMQNSLVINLKDPRIVYYRCVVDNRPESMRNKFPYLSMIADFELKTGLRPLPKELDDKIPHAIIGLWDIQMNSPDARMVWYFKGNDGLTTNNVEREERLVPVWTTRMGYPRIIDLERIRKGNIPVINNKKVAEGDWGDNAPPLKQP